MQDYSLNQELVNQLAELCGLTGSYQDWDRVVTIAIENKILLLQNMGFDLSSDETLAKAIAKVQRSIWSRRLPVVRSCIRARTFELVLRNTASDVYQPVELTVSFEQGGELSLTANPSELNVVEHKVIDGSEYIAVNIELPADMPLGYHSVTMAASDETCSLIVVPETCYEPEAMKAGKKIWGSGIQLYSVRSQKNWGMGDYSDLDALIKGLADNGADFIGLNPLHALYQANPLHASPYSPSSRTYANVLYINPEAVPEFYRMFCCPGSGSGIQFPTAPRRSTCTGLCRLRFGC